MSYLGENGVTGISETKVANGVTVEYYDLSGRRVNTPQKGMIGIVKRQDGSVFKVIVK